MVTKTKRIPVIEMEMVSLPAMAEQVAKTYLSQIDGDQVIVNFTDVTGDRRSLYFTAPVPPIHFNTAGLSSGWKARLRRWLGHGQ